LLAVSIWAAVKQALAHVGVNPASLGLPASHEEILLALTRGADPGLSATHFGGAAAIELPAPQL
jgi:coproporphyrinogen III oxidase-like Fe-S oxidoreductase